MLRYALGVALAVSLPFITLSSPSMAQGSPTFMELGRAKAALYKPDSGPEPHVGIIVMHRESNYLNNVACGEFAKRGFMVLCMNSRFENSEASVKWELIPLDVSEGVDHLTVRSFLSSNAIRSTNSMDEKQINLCSSNNSTPCMLQSISVPLLAVAQQASFQNLIQEVEINYLNSKSTDKDFIVIEGSMTSIGACTNCAKPASEYANARKNFFDYTAKWINDRF